MSAILPKPRQLVQSPAILEGLKVLIISDAINNLTKRINLTLKQLKVGTTVTACGNGSAMENAVKHSQPDVIVCPFLTKYIPETIWRSEERPCLVFHPGIVGDRGPSSIDWAIRQQAESWGGTLLQASEVMDGGDIWSTANFPLKADATKTGVYCGEISDVAADAIVDGLMKFRLGIPPTPLDYTDPDVKGCLLPSMKSSDRKINWDMSAEEICRIIRCSDTQPGAIASLTFSEDGTRRAETYRVFGAFQESGLHKDVQDVLGAGTPGSVVGKKQGAVLVSTGDRQGVWITCMKRNKRLSIKLPATSVLPASTVASLPDLTNVSSHSEIWLKQQGPVCYVHFDFYNGAMDSRQGAELAMVLKQVAKMSHVKVVVLMGGSRFFSTGIHLCQIEASGDPAKEANNNINKINDVILAMSQMRDKLVVAALEGNAGAGGAMMAAAADVVVSAQGVLLSPAYRSMGLCGSEYWTHFLPRRVGRDTAYELMYARPDPLLAEEARSLGLVDHVLGRNKHEFQEMLPGFVENLASATSWNKTVQEKFKTRNSDWFDRLSLHRQRELHAMEQCFNSAAFQRERQKFVYKLNDEQLVDAAQENPSLKWKGQNTQEASVYLSLD